MEEFEQKQSHKRARLSETADALQTDFDRRTAEVKRGQELVAAWKRILAYMTSMDTHGSKKPPDMFWDHYFDQALEPLALTFAQLTNRTDFHDVDATFDECLMKLTCCVGQSASDLEMAQSKLNQAKKKLTQWQGRKDKHTEREQKILQKLDQQQEVEQKTKTLV